MYKRTFVKYEINLLNKIKRNDTRALVMTVYSKMKKYADEYGYVTRTISDILKLLKKHRDISRTTLFRILSKLKELNLIYSENGKYYITYITRINKESKGRSEKLVKITNSEDYKKYLESEHWLNIKENAKVNANNKCQLCGETKNLHVHHNNYECLGRETLADIIVLCNRCHAKHHNLAPNK